MSTICKLALNASLDAVRPVIETWLEAQRLPFSVDDSDWPAASERGSFLVSEASPTILSLKQVTERVTEIHFNSFNPLDHLASRLSAALGTRVIVNIYQSTSTASYWALHDGGIRVRAVEAGDGVISDAIGAALPFEAGDQSGSPDTDELATFDDASQSRYNLAVGVPVEVYQEFESGWVNLRIAPTPAATRAARGESATPEHRDVKPWWRFW